MGDGGAAVIQWRFVATMAHFIVVWVALFHKDANVAASLAPGASEDDVSSTNAALTAGLVLSLLLFVLHWIGLFAGVSLFMRRVNLMALLLHGLGAVLTAWFVADAWRAESYWGLWLAFNLTPALGEVLVLLGTFLFRWIEW
uniref:Transmembrane protein 107 n=1 Tax=Bicosoecida sp. CB-2014 TaxID=1486930 RepID=A0A6T6WPW1_9STRA|mmetsp:Transcript_22159/g.77664  ORF Transcript_22159/g.77664 Transcript_22159/m.77664 type:complete len:142 (+) Transcript_22159:111-536(+)